MKLKLPWFTGLALCALGEHALPGKPFTVRELARWVPAFAARPGYAKLALQALRRQGLVELTDPVAILRQHQLDSVRWWLTFDGHVLARSVAQEHPGAAPADPTALATRLWALLGIRRSLTSAQATAVLLDAGQGDAARMQRQIADCLRGWARTVPHAVKLRARPQDGCKCYVLVAAIGRRPPPLDGPPLVAVPRLTPVPERFAVAREEASQ